MPKIGLVMSSSFSAIIQGDGTFPNMNVSSHA